MKSKSVGRWIGEAILVFGSVVGAFYFEDVREDLREKEQYVNLLINLRNDIHDDVYKFRASADTALGLNCSLCDDTTELGQISRFLRYETGNKDSINFLIMSHSAKVFVKWRFPSPYIDEIIKHSDLIEEDSLRSSISLYNEIYLSEHLSYATLNEQNQKNADLLQSTVDYTNPADINKLVDIMILRNRLLSSYLLVQEAMQFDLINASELSSIVRIMDSKLADHKVDTSKLEKRWLVKN
ncbi:hypothetical protein [Ekhidna sp.]